MKRHWFPILLFISIAVVVAAESISGNARRHREDEKLEKFIQAQPVDTNWWGSNKYQIPTTGDSGKMIWYGHELIANTSYYLGPKGIVAQTTNGMNCQNCHLEGGIIPYGNNFGKVYSTYPQYRARNNATQSIYDRINDCFQRSLNGKKMDSSTREMRAMYAYFKWVGEDVPKGEAPAGTGIMKLPYLDRPADPAKGRQVYATNCQSCHGKQGEGQLNETGSGYTYPPLWGPHSYNDGAGLYRITRFAGFVKNNMPFGTRYDAPKLTNDEAWDVAAFVNSQPRPHKDQSADWQDISRKPIDFPFGPFADTFSIRQHKYGPYRPIINFKKQ